MPHTSEKNTTGGEKEVFVAPGVLKNSLFNGFGYVFNLVLVFFLTPIIIHRLGKDAYGIWVILVGLTGYLGLMDFGIRSALGKYFAEYAAQKDYQRINSFFNTIFFLFLLLMVIVSLIGITVVYLWLDSFKIPDFLKKDAKVLGYLFSIFIGLSFPLSVPLGILSGFRRFDILNLNSLFIRSIRAGLILIYLTPQNGLYRLFLIHIGTSILEYLVLYWYCLRYYPFLRLSFFHFNLNQFKQTAQFGLNSFIIKIADTLIFYTDTLIVGRFLSTAMVSVYAPAESLISYIRSLVIAIINVTLPEASHLDSLGDYNRLRWLAAKTTQYLSLLIVPVAIAILFFADEFILLWLGEDFLIAATLMKILVIPQVSGLIMHGLESALYGINRHKSLAKLMMVIAFSNLVLSLLFMQWWGVYGVAWGTAVPLFLGQLIGTPLFSKRYYGLDLHQLFQKMLLPTLLKMLPLIGVFYFLNSIVEIYSYLQLLGVLFFGFLSWLPFFFLAIDSDDRKHLISMSVGFSRMLFRLIFLVVVRRTK